MADQMNPETTEPEGKAPPTAKKPDVTTLSGEAQEVVTAKKIAAQKKLKEWFNLLQEVAGFDEASDDLRRRAGKKMTIFLVLTIVFLFLSFPFFVFVVPPVLFLVFLVLTIIFWKKKSRLKKVDLDNEFRNVLIPFLQTMSEDFHPKSKIEIEIDMGGPTEDKISSKGEIDPGRFRRVVQTIYDDPWCRVEAPLVGGGRLLLNIDNQYVVHDRYWRNPRGKSKHKAKWKKLVQVTAGLAPNDDSMQFDREEFNSASVMEKMKLSEKEKGSVARLNRKFKFKAVNAQPEGSVTVDDLVNMFFYLGSTLTAAGPETVAGPAQS